MDLFSPKIHKASEPVSRLRARVIEVLALPESAVVMVTELACAEEDCPEIETVVAVMQQGGGQLKVNWPVAVAEVSEQDTQQICDALLRQVAKASSTARSAACA